MANRVRALAGVLLKDFLPYMMALSAPGEGYLALRNRAERLERAPDGSGYRCLWRWTSKLHAPTVLPSLGRGLMRRALARHPIELAPKPKFQPATSPEVSFLIGHRGAERLPHLLATLRSIAAQSDSRVECIVVEQETVPQLPRYLPPWVRLIHTPPPKSDMPYCRSWAFNVAARHSQAPVLVLHDNDMLIPRDYAAEIISRVNQGYEVIDLKRFIFYLSQPHTEAMFRGAGALLDSPAHAIVQNLQGGGSVAISREGFERIGGMNESFVGWGGEDNEFWERAETLRVWPWAHLPIVHLWHSGQAGKHDSDYPTATLYNSLRPIPPHLRIKELLKTPRGAPEGPVGFN